MGADEELLPSGPANGPRNRDDWSTRFDQSALPEIDVVGDEAVPSEPAGVEPPSRSGGLPRTPELEIVGPDVDRDAWPRPAAGAPAPPEPELSTLEAAIPEGPAEDEEEPGIDLDALVQEALVIADSPRISTPAPPEPELSTLDADALEEPAWDEPELSAPEAAIPEGPAEEDEEEPGIDLDALVQEALASVDGPPDAAPAPTEEAPVEQYLDGEQARVQMSAVLAALRGAHDEPEPPVAPADGEAAQDEMVEPSPAEAAAEPGAAPLAQEPSAPAPTLEPPAPAPTLEPPAPAPTLGDPPPPRSAPPEPWQRIAEDLSDVELDRALDVFERLAGKGGRIDMSAVTELAAVAPAPAAARAAAARDQMLVGFPTGAAEIVMTIAEIERVAGPLPAGARSSGIWWADWIARSPEGYRWRVTLDAARERVVFRPVEESALG